MAPRRTRTSSIAAALLLAGACQMVGPVRSFVSICPGGLSRTSGHALRGRRSAPGGGVRGLTARLAAAVEYEVGDKVKAKSPEDERWYLGRVDLDNGDGTFVVRWDDADGGDETNDLGPESLKKVIIYKDYKVGDDCKAMSPNEESWHSGTVAKINNDGTFKVKWDDRDGGDKMSDTDPEFMRSQIIFNNYKKGDVVDAKFPDDGNMYPGKVINRNMDGTFQVRWEDPDGGPTDSPIYYKDMRYPPISVDSLEVGQKYRGTVMALRDFGALVDDGKISLTMVESKIALGGARKRDDLTPFTDLDANEFRRGIVQRIAGFGAFIRVTLDDGSEAEGLCHITQIREAFVDKIEDAFGVGQEVRVRVQSVDLETNRMILSMKEAGASGGGAPRSRAPVDWSLFKDIKAAQWLDGTVARIASFGAFVAVKSPDGYSTADGLVHITQIRDGFVESVESEVEVGQEVRVRIIALNLRAGKMSLTMKKAESDGEEE
mmetsp:Transcript_3702/g.12209  ORF Transcript_3702/g.12209 Transcript_3702/m.12209 type:complete len:489 (-) Transcript_3702:146-1612(-)